MCESCPDSDFWYDEDAAYAAYHGAGSYWTERCLSGRSSIQLERLVKEYEELASYVRSLKEGEL